MTTERRTIEPTPGRRMQIDLLVPPDLRAIDLAAAPGPRSAAMLERADEALRSWEPSIESDDAARDRIRVAREVRRGERASVDVATPLLERDAGARTTDDDVERIRAAERVAETAARGGPLTLDAIRRIHATVVGRTDTAPYRNDIVWIGDRSGPNPGQRFQPAAPERIAPSLQELEHLLGSSGNPIVIAALAFAQLPVIHPWLDGNGRTGRIVADAALGAALPHAGAAPRVSDAIARRFQAASVGLDAWWFEDDLDTWVAMYAGAVVQATTDSTAGRRRTWWPGRRRADR